MDNVLEHLEGYWYMSTAGLPPARVYWWTACTPHELGFNTARIEVKTNVPGRFGLRWGSGYDMYHGDTTIDPPGREYLFYMIPSHLLRIEVVVADGASVEPKLALCVQFYK